MFPFEEKIAVFNDSISSPPRTKKDPAESHYWISRNKRLNPFNVLFFSLTDLLLLSPKLLSSIENACPLQTPPAMLSPIVFLLKTGLISAIPSMPGGAHNSLSVFFLLFLDYIIFLSSFFGVIVM